MKINVESKLILAFKNKVFDYSLFTFQPLTTTEKENLPQIVTAKVFLMLVKEKNKTYLNLFSDTEHKILYDKLYALFRYIYITKNAYFLSFYTEEYSTEDNPPFFDAGFMCSLNKLNIDGANRINFSIVKPYIDFISKVVHNYSRELYYSLCYKRANKKTKKKQLDLDTQIKLGIFSCDIFYEELLKKQYIIIQVIQSDQRIPDNGINFVALIKLYVTKEVKVLERYFYDFDYAYNQNKTKSVPADTAKQCGQYLNQISIYICLCDQLLNRLKAVGVIIDRYTFFQLRNTFVFDYETQQDHVTISQGNQPTYIYITPIRAICVPLNEHHLNIRIAFLNQMELFYFNKLEYLYILATHYLKKTKEQS